MESILRELRFALRQLTKSAGFTLTALLTLAFGIGATTGIFSIVEGVLLRPLPFADPGSLVVLGDRLEGVDYGDIVLPYVTGPGMGFYMRDTHAFASLGAYKQTTYELSGAGTPEQINAARLTASMIPTLGVSPLLGRAFNLQDDEGRQQVALISYQMWHGRFHGDARILGQKLMLDRKPYEIIGVMPREFEFPLVPGQLNRVEVWVPMSLTQAEVVQGAGSWSYNMVGRLAPGVTAAQAAEDAQGAAREIMRNFPPALASRKLHAVVRPLDETTVGAARPLVRTLFLAVAVVLFIACANLAGLLLVRVIRRRRETSVRLALGASRAVVLRQSLVEALLLSMGGGLLGLGLAAVALRVGVSLLPETLPRVSSIGLDWKVVAFAVGLAVFTGLLCGVIPAVAATRTRVNDALKEGGRTGSAGGGHARLRSVLVVLELAVALVLLTASGLLLRSFEKMRGVNLGFQADHLLTASYSLPRQQYSTQAAVDTFNAQLRNRLEQLPGVQAVGFATELPTTSDYSLGTFTPEGYVRRKGDGLGVAWPPQVMGDFFLAAGIPMIRGRAFTAADGASAPLVVIVNKTLVDRYWAGQDPIGKRLHRGPAEAKLPWLTVVGEIGEMKQFGADSPTINQFYLPAAQAKVGAGSFAAASMLVGNGGSLLLRSSIPPEQMADSLRAAFRAIDAQLPLTSVESMDRVVAEGQAPQRFNTAVISSFAAAALLLSLLGIYSVIAFSAALRTQEMAIRLALGSQRAAVVRLVLASAMKLGAAGCVIGVVGAVFATRLLRSLLFEVDPLDPAVMAVAAVCILLVAVAASVIPARRAAQVDPMQALRDS
jgi:putative ABC transport system permease protein